MSDAKRAADPAHPSFRLDDSPYYWLSRVSNRYVQDLDAVLKSVGTDVPGWRSLMVLRERQPSSVSEIAERAAFRLSTMTRVVQRLEEQGLVRLDKRAADGRKTDVYLTPDGEAAMENARARASKIFQVGFDGFTAAEVKTLVALLQRIYANLDWLPTARRGR